MIRYLINNLCKSKNKKNPNMLEKDFLNFETDSLRFTYEAYLSEYQMVRSEMETRLNHQEKSINYLLLIFAAVLSATQLFTAEANDIFLFLSKNPFIFLIFIIISLYFPYIVVINNSFIAVLASYTSNILTPKIDAITCILSNHSDATVEFKKWENENYPQFLIGTFRWDEFRSKIMYKNKWRYVFAVYSFFEAIFVSLPSIIFIIVFIVVKIKTNLGFCLIEIILMGIIMLLIISLILGVMFGGRIFLELGYDKNDSN